MTKTTGLGDRLYIGGVDMSGDIGAIGEIGGGPTGLVDVTNNTQNAVSRIATTLAGRLTFDVWHDPAVSHPPLAALPTADVVATYINGPSQACAGLVARQVDYPPKRGTDGALSFTVQVLSDGSGLEWGRGYVGGPSRTDIAPTNGNGVDDGAPTSAGMAAYLHVLAFTGISATVAVQHSNDNGATDPYTTIITFTSVTASGNGQRVSTLSTLTIKRWMRVISTGTFALLTFHAMAFRGVSTAVIVTVDVQIFTTSGTWTKPAGVLATFVAAVGGGAGGGGGDQSGGSFAISGGSGGGAGGMTYMTFPAALMSATEAVTVGAAGAGGPAGNPGGNAGISRFGTAAKVIANPGLPGSSANVGTVTGGAGGLAMFTGGTGGNAPQGAIGGTAPSTPERGYAAAGGGAGGGVDASNVGYAGGTGASAFQLLLGGGLGGTGVTGGAGGAGSGAGAGSGVGGSGGGGGGAGSGSTNGGVGGAGGSYGAGGGGGGSSPLGVGGAGGPGAPGIVVVISW